VKILTTGKNQTFRGRLRGGAAVTREPKKKSSTGGLGDENKIEREH